MPIIKSAKKRVRQTIKRRARNYARRSRLKTAIKNTLTAISDKKADEAKKLLPGAYREIDLAAKNAILHKNNAARKKARLARLLKALESK